MNRSYGCSKSEDFEILSPLPKIRGVAKKQHSVNIEFWVPKLKLAEDNPIGYIEFEFRASNPKIGRVLFFRNASSPYHFFLKFDLTLTANNDGLNHLNPYVSHIF